ncbi:hypothetical protein PsYK624_090110 [Phanerochaete sordida]|uniref:Uncharacterized protein n=1 Tax=Phanerochaete sordida TaxID=48140 RepID=A0A9P3GB70_9APHY|nr:hypothetical protein PsYK624_090110 [Phanerochaete sordida]
MVVWSSRPLSQAEAMSSRSVATTIARRRFPAAPRPACTSLARHAHRGDAVVGRGTSGPALLRRERAALLSPAASMSSGEPSDTGVRVDTAASPISSSLVSLRAASRTLADRLHSRHRRSAFAATLVRSSAALLALRSAASARRMLASRLPPPPRRCGSWISGESSSPALRRHQPA